jgi:hypothetical protein
LIAKGRSKLYKPVVVPADCGIAGKEGAGAHILGPAILIASRLGAYALAAWGLLTANGTTDRHDDGSSELPFHAFCESLRLRLKHHVLVAARVPAPPPAELVSELDWPVF